MTSTTGEGILLVFDLDSEWISVLVAGHESFSPLKYMVFKQDLDDHRPLRSSHDVVAAGHEPEGQHVRPRPINDRYDANARTIASYALSLTCHTRESATICVLR